MSALCWRGSTTGSRIRRGDLTGHGRCRSCGWRCPVIETMAPPLLREPAFRRYWSAQTVSLFGDQVTLLAMPLLAVLAIGAGAGPKGRLAAAGVGAHLLV